MAVVTIDCPAPYDDYAVMQSLLAAKGTHAFDAGQQMLLDKLIAGMALKVNPVSYQRPEIGSYVGGGLVAARG